MSTSPGKTSRRVLEPVERISEVLFGLIMVLTFTGSLSIAESGREDVRTMLIGALGCNIAWGIIDGILYLMGCLAERGRDLRMYRTVRDASDPKKAQRLIADALPDVVANAINPQEYAAIHERLKQQPEPSARAKLGGADWRGALGVFLLVFLSTLPVTVPFMFMDGLSAAMRTSNGIAVGMLFITGLAYGKCVGGSPWKFGISMVILGVALVAMTMALGG